MAFTNEEINEEVAEMLGTKMALSPDQNIFALTTWPTISEPEEIISPVITLPITTPAICSNAEKRRRKSLPYCCEKLSSECSCGLVHLDERFHGLSGKQ